MFPRRTITRLALAALCTLLPSCVFFPNIGRSIREPGEVYTSVSLRPVDGKVYKRTEWIIKRYKHEKGIYTPLETITSKKRLYDKDAYCRTEYFVRVPELTFTERCPLFHVGALLESYPESEKRDIRLTGNIKVARVELGQGNRPCYVEAILDELPADATFSHRLKDTDSIPEGVASERDINSIPHAVPRGKHQGPTKAGWGRRIAAAPFDYAIDPALKTIFYTGEAAWFLALAPLAGVYYIADSACEQEQKDEPEH